MTASGFPAGIPAHGRQVRGGFVPGFRELATSRNGKGRFAGIQVGGFDMGELAGLMSASYAGKLTGKRASGTLSATITVVDQASGNTVTTCRTGSVRWSATRAPGRVFAGSTAQDHPVVVRVDAKRRKVSDLIFGWQSEHLQARLACSSASTRTSADFPLSSGRFGDAFKLTYIAGRGRRGQGRLRHHRARRPHPRQRHRSASISPRPTRRGTSTTACDSGSVSWSAVTG